MENGKYSPIMDITASHNKKLVTKINYLFCDKNCKESRLLILHALAQRDSNEVYNKLGVLVCTLDEAETYADRLLMNVCDDNDLETIIKFCYGDMDGIREKKIRHLAELIRKVGEMNFDGDFVFCGNDYSSHDNDCFYNYTKLMGLHYLNYTKDNLRVHSIIKDACNRFTQRYVDTDFIPDFELDRLIEYVEKQMQKKKWHICVTASRTFEVMASNYEEALSLAEQEYDKDPINSGDIDGWSSI